MFRGYTPARDIDCAVCATRFTTRHSRGKYCSPACQRVGERASWRKYGAKNKVSRRGYSNEHYARDPQKVIDRTVAYHRTERGKEVVKEVGARQRKKFPEKYAARQAVHVAVLQGRLVPQACRDCGAPKTHGHHTDYSKPLEVIWLCPKHHAAEHERMRKIEHGTTPQGRT